MACPSPHHSNPPLSGGLPCGQFSRLFGLLAYVSSFPCFVMIWSVVDAMTRMTQPFNVKRLVVVVMVSNEVALLVAPIAFIGARNLTKADSQRHHSINKTPDVSGGLPLLPVLLAKLRWKVDAAAGTTCAQYVWLICFEINHEYTCTISCNNPSTVFATNRPRLNLGRFLHGMRIQERRHGQAVVPRQVGQQAIRRNIAAFRAVNRGP